jgi:hypothetical protein
MSSPFAQESMRLTGSVERNVIPIHNPTPMLLERPRLRTWCHTKFCGHSVEMVSTVPNSLNAAENIRDVTEN